MIKAKNDQIKKKNLRSTKHAEIKLLICRVSAENPISRNTSTQIRKALELYLVRIHDIAYSKRYEKDKSNLLHSFN